jgi:glycerol-3-phosphate acyltransferase PlsX
MYRIALDVMGGDHAPHSTLEGARLALEANEALNLLLVGDEHRIRPLLDLQGIRGGLAARTEVVHASSVVTMDDKATCILKDKRDSSIRIAAKMVREGMADGLVTMGNTGAAMIASMKVIGMLPGVDRPCLASVVPNMRGGPTVLLDVGANVDSRSEHLVHFALMGAVYAEQVLGIRHPRVGILSVGEEDAKGNETTKAASLVLRAMEMNFRGNAEGRDIWNGSFDVIACDGFVGNVVLKSSEALAEGLMKGIRDSVNEDILSRLGGLLVRSAIMRFKKKRTTPNTAALRFWAFAAYP